MIFYYKNRGFMGTFIIMFNVSLVKILFKIYIKFFLLLFIIYYKIILEL